MGKMGNFNSSDFNKLQKELEKLKDGAEEFQEHCTKKLAQGLISKVKKRTPVGKYSDTVEFDANIPEKQVDFTTKGGKHVSFIAKARKKHIKFSVKKGKKGGTLRRRWTATPVVRANNITSSEIINPTEYASYVENGHRTASGRGWVQGKFMLKISSEEVQAAAPRVIKAEMDKWLGGALK